MSHAEESVAGREFREFRLQTEAQFAKLLEYVRAEGEQTRRHFDVALEDLRHDLQGAAADAQALYRDKHTDHERRLRRLEGHAGMAHPL